MEETKKETPEEKEERLRKKREERAKRLQEDLDKHPGGFGKRVPKTDQNPNGWIECDYDTTTISKDKKTILFFGGNGITTSKDANFGSKFVESLTGKAEENDFDLYSFYYDRPNDEATTGMLSVKHSEKVVDAFLSPLVKDENGNFYNEETVRKNLGNLVMFGHCHGSSEVECFLMDLNNMLAGQFGEEKSKELTNNVLAVYYAPVNRFAYSHGTVVEFVSARDGIFGLEFKIWDEVSDEYKKFEGLAYITESPNKNGIDVVSDTFVSTDMKFDEHNLGLFTQKDGVIDREVLPQTDKETEILQQWQQGQKLATNKKQNKAPKYAPRPNAYSRQQMVSDMLASVLSYGLVHDERNIEEIKMILDAQIKRENKNVQEKQQQAKRDEQRKQKEEEHQETENNVKSNTEEFAQV